jgi:hypothetical protein
VIQLREEAASLGRNKEYPRGEKPEEESGSEGKGGERQCYAMRMGNTQTVGVEAGWFRCLPRCPGTNNQRTIRYMRQ